jgi:hypothetical protein
MQYATMKHSVISGFHHEIDENCSPLGYYVASSDNPLPSYGIKRYSLVMNNHYSLVMNYHYSLRNTPEECSSQWHRPSIPNTLVSLKSHTFPLNKRAIIRVRVPEILWKRKSCSCSYTDCSILTKWRSLYKSSISAGFIQQNVPLSLLAYTRKRFVYFLCAESRCLAPHTFPARGFV